MELTLLLVITCNFVNTKITVACFVYTCKWATKLSAKRYYRLMLSSSILRMSWPMSARRSYRRQSFTYNPIEMKSRVTVGVCKQLLAGSSSLQIFCLVTLAKLFFNLTFTLGTQPSPPGSVHVWPKNSFQISFDHTKPCLICWSFPCRNEVEMKNK